MVVDYTSCSLFNTPLAVGSCVELSALGTGVAVGIGAGEPESMTDTGDEGALLCTGFPSNAARYAGELLPFRKFSKG